MFSRCNACFQRRRLLHYSTVTSTNGSYSNYFVHSLGFSQQQALSISTTLFLRRRNRVIDSKFVENANAVVALFRNLGFHDTLIRNIVSKQPRLLASDIYKTLKPKFTALHDEDFSQSDVIRVISKRPEILFYGLESSILPTVHTLRQVVGSVGNVINTMERLSEPYFCNIAKSLLPNVTLLSSYEVPLELIRKQLLHKPWFFARNPKVFNDRVIRDQKKRGIPLQPPTTDSYADYLVDTLGFSHQQALSISTSLYVRRRNKGIDSRFAENADTVISLFHNLGFRKTHIRKIVSKEPILLASKVDRTLKPKIRLLQNEDFFGSDIIQVISSCPTILLYGLESTILPLIQILKQVMGSVCNVINTIERLTETHFCDLVKYLLPNVALLSSYGIRIELIRKHILYRPGCYLQTPEVFKDLMIRVVRNLGITRDSQKFLRGINLISEKREETINSKCQILKSFGWTQFDIETFMMNNARCFTISDERFKKKLDFLMNELQLKPAYLTSQNHFITCSLEKRIVPRHKILLILKERGLLKKNPPLCSAIRMSESCFLKRFVLPFNEVHQAYAKLTGCCVETLTPETTVIFS